METQPEPTEVLHEGRWLRLVRRGTWESCERTHHGDGLAVQIIAVTPGDEVLFVEQPRAAVGKRTIEMPAGLVGDGDGEDTLESAARRELVEETGWEPGRVEVLAVGCTTPGMSNERIALVRALDLRKVGDGGGVGVESITVHAVPRAQAPAWLLQKQREGFALDLKVWAGLWMIDHEPDGRRRA
ncbi:NUDIX hydrolase [Luteimonas wenzhouensis]|jgi:ADP-ribose pyrophosphatase|uniref:GDP-mannose pyrophosphatase n=1 Tax=Luteimonas wenzhouensis TaxID=2599615 RepID=A0A5C5U7R2_9GAMM|nr:NUDIX hydrolase [Luteimonas wenzhouensis]NLW95406.1 NUDIX hydrolase [Xanthomonadaceae bacterium]TWT21947.1 NUDIX hydrolase [Luteimonas wenzhouensis]